MVEWQIYTSELFHPNFQLSPKIVPKEEWIKPGFLNAFSTQGSKIHDLIEQETGLIYEEELDKASEEIMDQYDKLMEFYESAK